MKLTMTSMMIMSFLMMMTPHPMIMIFMFSISACFLSLSMMILSMNYWFPMIMIMLLVGGLMILFSMAISSMKNYKMNTKLSMTSALILTTVLLMTNQKDSIILSTENKMNSSMKIMYSSSWFNLSMLTLIILLIMKMTMPLLNSPNKTIKTLK